MNRQVWIFAVLGLLVALALAVFVAPHASSAPDGLERVAADKGFLEKGEQRPLWQYALMPDYLVQGLGNGPMATAAAGFAGTLCAFIFGCVLARLSRRRKSEAPATPADAEASLQASSRGVGGQSHEGTGK